MKPKVGIIRFLGTNCDRDIWTAVELSGGAPEWLWYQDHFNPNDYKALVVPGGFSHGDYLRCGALAGKAPVMSDVTKAAQAGVPILGICNGFQILCETGLLPGALVRNESLRFIDKWVCLNTENQNPHWKMSEQLCRLPIAHGEGRFVAEESVISELFDKQQVAWTYENNPNGSLGNIAGVMNKEKNIVGLMPHPERAMESWMGGSDGMALFQGVLS